MTKHNALVDLYSARRDRAVVRAAFATAYGLAELAAGNISDACDLFVMSIEETNLANAYESEIAAELAAEPEA